jgi:proteasome lid subunit RPN8/RPN11
VKITKAVLADIIDHAQSDAPNECCGILAVDNWILSRAYRATNVADRPRHDYRISAVEQYQISCEIHREGFNRLQVVYHSHPTTGTEPSQLDSLALNMTDATLQVIISLAGGMPEVRAYGQRHGFFGDINEIDLVVIND